MKQNSVNETINLRKIGIILFAGYIFLAIAFYFLSGDQLHFRQSRGNLSLPAPSGGTVELVQGNVVEQTFSVKIQRLYSVSVQCSTSYRTNSGTVYMELIDTRSNKVLMSGSFDAETITEGMLLTLSVEQPIESIYDVPLLLRLSGDSPTGEGITTLITAEAGADNRILSVNGEAVAGNLCLAAQGEDYIWTGLHYWEFMGVGLLLLALFWGCVSVLQRNNKHSYVINALIAMKKYKFLIRQLVARDFKTKYKRSVLGAFWSFLNPLLMMSVQYFVFSTLFANDIPNYSVYLLIGIVCFNFFSEACGMSLTSILGNATLINKVYVPKYIYPLTRTISSVINLVISLVPLLIVCLVTGVQFKPAAILSFYFLACLIVFSLGIGLLLSASMVFFRDTQFLWSVLSMIWMYATPIFYPESILPQQFKIVLQVNPLYYFLKSIRMCILDGLSPEPIVYVQCFGFALIMLLIGALVFRKSQDRFILYL